MTLTIAIRLKWWVRPLLCAATIAYHIAPKRIDIDALAYWLAEYGTTATVTQG